MKWLWAGLTYGEIIWPEIKSIAKETGKMIIRGEKNTSLFFDT